MQATSAQKKAKSRSFWTIMRQDYLYYIFLLPSLVVTILFAYIPMFTNVVAFMDYVPYKGWMGLESDFVGFANFQSLMSDPGFWILVQRTIYYSVLISVVTFPASILFALLLNEVRNMAFKRIVQTVSYLPYFVSWVTIASLFYIFMSQDTAGIINNIRGLFGLERVIFMKYPSNFPAVLVISSLYKGLGWGSIIYLAAIAGVDAQLYEAARIDGASRFRQAWNITLPSILPTITIMLVMSMGSLFSSNFDQVYTMQNPLISPETDTIATYTYVVSLVKMRYSAGATIGLFQGVVNAIFLLGSDKISKKLSGYGLF